MTSNRNHQKAKHVFQNQTKSFSQPQTHGDVVQDKTALTRGRAAIKQPAPREKPARLREPINNPHRSKKHGSTKRKTVHLVLWVNPIVKAELQRLAAQEGLSMSQAAGALLKRALAGQIDMHYNALLTPVIESAIKKSFAGYTNRLAWLLTRVSFDAEQTRAIVTNILGRQQGMTEEKLKNILAMSQRTAKGNLTRRSPEMLELIDAIEKWLHAEDKEKQDPAN
jgi:hypothetical protein